ncbi:MAG TPA: tetratricopeptide repeat protein [Rhodocyclaceae bacterium]|jgi:tetratricopeptide (TPR) repeat protein|nr:tetratricopeptide repeat protein [Rhodocyclaceae bacterium]
MTVRRALTALAPLGLIAGLNFSIFNFACADTLQDASRLLRQGQQAQALEQVDKYLADKPKDAQARFIKGTALTEMGRTNDAIAIFNKLIEDYPTLPEPYNNLAVIYAQQKQYDKARLALEAAIRTNPAYATAQENLGDIYARLASQAYGKALQLDSSNGSAQTKLALIRELTSTTSRTTPPSITPEHKPATPPAVPVVPPTTTPPVIAAAPTTKPAEAIPAPTKVEPSKTEPAKVEPPKTETKPEVKPEAKPDAEVARAIEAWAAAWSKKDVKAYLARYAKDFKVPGGGSRAAWETERAQRVGKPGKIAVSVDNIKVSADSADQVTVKFRQNYKSATLSSSATKTLVLVKRDGKWLILQERVGG